MRDVICVILGGGRGRRLMPLTKYRSKPAVPLAGKYRLIDVPISNCLNSGYFRIYVLTQFNSESLNRHIAQTYHLDRFRRGYVQVIAAEQSMDGSHWFQGTADAVRQVLRHLREAGASHIIILSGDHLYKMDLSQVMSVHLDSGAEVTVACTPTDRGKAASLGVMKVDRVGRIVDFLEKPGPKQLDAFLGEGEVPLASMGIYVFRIETLVEMLVHSDATDFGSQVIPEAVRSRRTFAYRFDGYWEDIGTIPSFYEANLALTAERPPFDLFDEDWELFTHPRHLPPSKLMDANLKRTIVADGCRVIGVEATDSIIGLRSVVRSGTIIERSIIMGFDYFPHSERARRLHKDIAPGIGRDCVIRNAIIDKNVCIGDGVKIINRDGHDNFDGPYYSIRDGIVVVEKSAVILPGTVI